MITISSPFVLIHLEGEPLTKHLQNISNCDMKYTSKLDIFLKMIDDTPGFLNRGNI